MKYRGFTLLETVLVISLTVVILLALVNVYLMFTRLYSYEQTFVPTAQSANRTITAVTDAVLIADKVLAQHTISGVSFSLSTTTLVLELPSITSSGSIIPGTYDYIAFYASSTDVYRATESGAGSARVTGIRQIGGLMDSLTFTYDNTDPAFVTKIDTDIVTQTVVQQQTVRSHLHEQTSLRNN